MTRGFTLMEILVALAVLAILVVSLGGLSSSQLANARDADRLLAGELLAENELNRILAAPEPIALGQETKTVTFAEQPYQLSITTTATDAALLRRVEIAVSVTDYLARQQVLTTLVGFRGQH